MELKFGLLIRFGLLFIGILAMVFATMLYFWEEELWPRALFPAFLICGMSLIIIAIRIK